MQGTSGNVDIERTDLWTQASWSGGGDGSREVESGMNGESNVEIYTHTHTHTHTHTLPYLK